MPVDASLPSAPPGAGAGARGRTAGTGPGGTGAGTALIALSAASFGVMPVITKLVYEDGASAVGLLSARFTLAGLVLLLLARQRREPLPRGRSLAALIGLGGIGYAGESLCYFLALDHASAGVVALLLYLYPALVVLLVAATTRHLPGPLTLGCLVAAVVGCALTVGPSGGADALGIAFGLGAAASYSVYIVLSGRVVTARAPVAASAVVMLAAAATDDVLAAATGAAYPRHASGWAGVLAVALVCTVVAVSAFFAGLARIGPSRASIVSTIEPVVSVALGVAVLSEPLSAAQGLGGALVLAAVAVLAVSGGDRGRPATAEARVRSGPAPGP